MKSYKSKKQRATSHEIDEGSFVKRVEKELGNQAELVNDSFWEQLLGSAISSEEKSGESTVFELSKLRKLDKETSENKKIRAEIQPGIEYHREYYESITKFAERASYRETMQESRKIQQIMAEIKKLASSTKSLQVEFGLITLEEPPIDPGQYYVNFFEWMLIMLKQARQKVEDSKSWLETVQGKKKKKAGYWDKAKKHGTTFSQANERFVATSTG